MEQINKGNMILNSKGDLLRVLEVNGNILKVDNNVNTYIYEIDKNEVIEVF